MNLIPGWRLERSRVRRSSPTFRDAYRRLESEARAFLDEGLRPQDHPAGYYHNYFCPDHAVELAFDADSPNAHRCPKDGRVFSGEPYDSAWRWFVNNRLSGMAYRLALMWQLDADAAYLARCREILLAYAERYPGYPIERELPYGWGKVANHSLDEAVWLIPIARAYDLVREFLSARERTLIETDLLALAAEHIQGQKFHRIHNIECWHNAAMAAVGICLDDAGFQKMALEDRFGFHHQLQEGVLDDGMWWEGSSSYHFYTLAALIAHVQVSETTGARLHDDDRLRAMFRAPVSLAYPDFRLPATNDCWYFSSLLADVCHGVPPAASFYEVAYGWYNEPVYAGILERNYAEVPRTAVESLLYGEELPDSGGEFDTESAVLKPSGVAILRSRDAVEAQSCVLLKYGPHGGGHGHPDKLSISYYAHGFPVATDLGTPGYGVDLNETWYRQTLSHNTVTVNGRSQPPAEGRLVNLDLQRADGFEVVDARVAWERDPYAGVGMRRVILWTDAYFWDLFHVVAPQECRLDWVCRYQADRQGHSGLSRRGTVALSGDGYAHVRQPVEYIPEETVSLQWGLSKGGAGVFLPEETGTRVVLGKAPLQPASETGDLLIRSRTARETTFVALMHHWDTEPAVSRVTAVGPDGAGGARGFLVQAGTETHLWAVSEDVPYLSGIEVDRTFSYPLQSPA
ncbi:MAG: heparinase II/III family protein [Gemmatimonadota bacterium]|nr:heparinase II/III family protein [Gemmatimonadota bacterium]